MLEWLGKNGYTHELRRTDNLHGVDIRRWNLIQRRYWFIETKGAPQKTYQKGRLASRPKSKQSQQAQRYTWFVSALGQIALRMKQERANYGVALPYSDYNRDVALRIRLFRGRAKVHFFLVDRSRRILQLTPGSHQFKFTN